MEMRKGTLFVRLPGNLQRPINGGCQCSHCKARPGSTPMWDTLAIDTATDRPVTVRAWTVHYPELVS